MNFSRIAEKVEGGQRLEGEEGIFLLRYPDLWALGRLAFRERERRWGRVAFYTKNAHLNYSNVCALSCRFCGFAAREGEEKAYLLSLGEVAEKVRLFWERGIREFHVVGGLHPSLPLGYYLDLVRTIKESAPGARVKAFTAVEILHLSRLSGLSVREVLLELREAGLDALPGGGAEIFSPRVRRLLCPAKPGGEEWLAVHREAHLLGIPSNATLLYGHVETEEELVDHLLRLRQLQDETGGFQCFVPLPYHPERERLPGIPGPTGVEDLRVMAVSRLLLDNFPHLKAYWVSLTPKLAQLCLLFGADDLDGTVVEERIYHAMGSPSPRGLSEEELRSLIREAGFEPRERDALYREVAVQGG